LNVRLSEYAFTGTVITIPLTGDPDEVTLIVPPDEVTVEVVTETVGPV
jgi:hypothetical protein